MIDLRQYNLNHGRQIQRLLPVAKKKDVFTVMWLYSLVKPLETLYKTFLEFMAEQREEAYANSQTGVLVHRLNKHFDPIQKRITITNHTLNNNSVVLYHFTVNLPGALPLGDPDAVREFVSRYVLADKVFEVI